MGRPVILKMSYVYLLLWLVPPEAGAAVIGAT